MIPWPTPPLRSLDYSLDGNTKGRSGTLPAHVAKLPPLAGFCKYSQDVKQPLQDSCRSSMALLNPCGSCISYARLAAAGMHPSVRHCIWNCPGKSSAPSLQCIASSTLLAQNLHHAPPQSSVQWPLDKHRPDTQACRRQDKPSPKTPQNAARSDNLQ